jgi:hypothetical protein
MTTKSVVSAMHNHVVCVAYCSDWTSTLDYNVDGISDNSRDDTRFSLGADDNIASFRLVRYVH